MAQAKKETLKQLSRYWRKQLKRQLHRQFRLLVKKKTLFLRKGFKFRFLQLTHVRSSLNQKLRF